MLIPNTPVDFENPVDWEALARYLSGESSTEEVAAIDAWLTRDPSRAALFGALDRALEPRLVAPRPEVDVEAALSRVRERIDQPAVHSIAERRGAAFAPRRDWRHVGRRVAAVAALLVGPVLVYSLATRDGAGPVSQPAVYATTTGQRDSLDLPDGSRLILGPESELTVLAGFGGDSRELVLVGEAMFDVEHDDARPFLVHVPGGTVEDLGTAFSVRTGSEHGVRVIVTEGSVRLRTIGMPAEDGLILVAGDRGAIPAGGDPSAERGAATQDDLSWTRGVLTFRDAPMSEVRAELRRWFGIDLRLSDPIFADQLLTASFENESIEQVVSVIALALGGRSEMRADTAFIHSIEETR